MELTPYLDDLESRIDSAQEAALAADWRRFLDRGCPDDIFCPSRRPSPAGIDWPRVHINDALEDETSMALHQLCGCSGTLAGGGGNLLAVRCNYGVSIMPTLFGAELYVMDRSFGSLPNSKPLAGGLDAIRRLVDAGVPDLETGQMGQVWSMARFYNTLFADRPLLREHVHIYHPDLQGPMDVCELLWGSELFVDLYEEPELVHALLALICETYERVIARWYELVPSRLPPGYSAHWGMMLKGMIMLRDDSAMNLSPEMFAEFIAPYDGRLLASCGGGAVHFCGRGDHYVDQLCRLDGLSAINMSQPDYNDMEAIFRGSLDQGKQILALPRGGVEAARASGRAFEGQVFCHPDACAA